MRKLLKTCGIKKQLRVLLAITLVMSVYLYGSLRLVDTSIRANTELAGRSTSESAYWASIQSLDKKFGVGLDRDREMNTIVDSSTVQQTLVSVATKPTEEQLRSEASAVKRQLLGSFQGIGEIIEERSGEQGNTAVIKKEKYKIVVGIPVAKRSPPTVLRTARQLVRYANSSEHKLLSWMSISAADDQETKQGLADLGFTVHAYHSPYQELQDDRLRITHNDPVERVKWRTGHCKLYVG